MPDPFADLRLPLTPMAPRRAFADDLRRRIQSAIDEGAPTVPTDTDPRTEPDATAGHATLVAHLVVGDARAALAWYAANLGAVETYRLDMPDGRVGHATMRIRESEFQLADEYPEMGIVGPDPDRRPPVAFTVQVADADAAFDRAVAAGAVAERPVADQFYGARTGTFRDPFGHVWSVSQHIEDVPEEELQRRVVEDQ